jgi:thiamine biosynthesis lipoprotein
MLFLTSLLCGCAESDSHSTHVMGTLVTATGTQSEVLSNDDVQLVLEIFHDVDALMSEWKSESPLSNVNTAAGDHPVQVPIDVFDAVRRALDIAELTDGAFDPTWAALWSLWDFETPSLPTEEEVFSRLSLVDWEQVQLEDQSIFLPEKGMALGLGGIAKGIALDRANGALHNRGVKNYMIVVGGQVLVSGTNDGVPWKIGIRKPDGTADEYIAILNVTDTCVSTSGDYEKYFEVDGIRYHHIIDPRTGFPARGTRSVTVITPDATLADALSTALFVMGPEQAIQLVNKLPDVEALIIDTSGQMHLSSEITSRLTFPPLVSY